MDLPKIDQPSIYSTGSRAAILLGGPIAGGCILNIEGCIGKKRPEVHYSYVARERFGIHYVDFNDPQRSRKRKRSAEYFKKLVKTRQLPDV